MHVHESKRLACSAGRWQWMRCTCLPARANRRSCAGRSESAWTLACLRRAWASTRSAAASCPCAMAWNSTVARWPALASCQDRGPKPPSPASSCAWEGARQSRRVSICGWHACTHATGTNSLHYMPDLLTNPAHLIQHVQLASLRSQGRRWQPARPRLGGAAPLRAERVCELLELPQELSGGPKLQSNTDGGPAGGAAGGAGRWQDSPMPFKGATTCASHCVARDGEFGLLLCISGSRGLQSAAGRSAQSLQRSTPAAWLPRKPAWLEPTCSHPPKPGL